MNPGDFIEKRVNKHSDPWNISQVLSHLLLGAFTIPALTLMVFLRPKLGYRLPKPWILIVNFMQFAWWVLLINLFWLVWHYAKIGLPEAFPSLQPYIHAGPTRTPMTDRPMAERWMEPELPRNWWDMTQAQRDAWVRQHPEEYKKLNDRVFQKQQELAAKEAEEDRKVAEAAKRFRPHWALFIFAVATTGAGFYRRKEGAKLLTKQWHTMSRGESYLHRLLKGFSEYRVQAFLEPLVCVVLGVAIAWTFSISLGLFVIYAAICLSISEMMVMEIAVNEALDKYDAELESRIYSDVRKRMKSYAEETNVSQGSGVRGAIFDAETIEALKRAAGAEPGM